MASNTTQGPARSYTLASRASKLAQIQTNIVRDALQSSFPGLTFATSFMSTAGDKNQSQALYLLGGKSLWTKELEVALKENVVDMLVHSLKDCPTVLPDGCEIGAVLEREDPVDCLVVRDGEGWKSLAEMPAGSVVGTSSVRRVAQLRRLYPGLVFLDVVSSYEFFLILQMLIDFRWIAGKFVSPACTPSYVSTLILLEL
jgi:hydroxymethylbilane synthase